METFLAEMQIPNSDKRVGMNVRKDLIRGGRNIDINTLWEVFSENVYKVSEDIFSKDNGIAIDLGAHIGAFSILCASLGAKKVYAYEPNPENFDLLIKNIELNKFEKIIIPKLEGIGEREDWVEMISRDRDSILNETFLKVKNEKPIDLPIFETKITTLEKMFLNHNIKECDVLKCDIEWSEYVTLAKANKMTLDKIKYLTLEFHGTSKEHFGELIANLSQSFVVETIGNYETGGAIIGRHY